MWFESLKMIEPLWYFHEGKDVIHKYFDFSRKVELGYYESEYCAQLDDAYIGFMSGRIPRGDVLPPKKKERISLHDELVFLRRHYKFHWILFFLCREVFALRFMGIILALIRTRHVPRAHYEIVSMQLPRDIPVSKPKVSVIIPTLNRYNYLKDALIDLENQTYKNFEVIVIDQSDNFKDYFYKDFELDIYVHYQSIKAVWEARNMAVSLSKGEYLLFFDDDSRVGEHWIESHMSAICAGLCDVSCGTSLSVIGGTVPKQFAHIKLADKLDTGNVLLHKETFKKTGNFNTCFDGQRMGDDEYGIRLYRKGYVMLSNSEASRVHYKADSGGLRESAGWDALRPKRFFSPRPVPSVLYLSRKYYGLKPTINYLILNIPKSFTPYHLKSNLSAKILSFLLSPILVLLFLPFIRKSWLLSTKMLKRCQM